MSKITAVLSAFVLAVLTGCASAGGDFVGTAAFNPEHDPAMHTAAWPYQKMNVDD